MLFQSYHTESFSSMYYKLFQVFSTLSLNVTIQLTVTYLIITLKNVSC